MGEVAEMMLEGILCQACGCYIDDDGAEGFPRYCSEQCARDHGMIEPPLRKSKKKPQKPYQHSSMRKRDAAWLRLAAARPGSLGYSGVQWDMCPSAFHRLKRLGFVESFTPHNPAHKERAVATDAGRAKLRAISSSDAPDDRLDDRTNADYAQGD